MVCLIVMDLRGSNSYESQTNHRNGKKMKDIFKENNWVENHDTYCCNCNKLRYMGKTTYPTDMHCVCHKSDDIPTYVDKDRLPVLMKEAETARLQRKDIVGSSIIKPYDPNAPTYYWHEEDVLIYSNTPNPNGCTCVPNGQNNKFVGLKQFDKGDTI